MKLTAKQRNEHDEEDKLAEYSQARIGLELYDLDNDVGESNDVVKEHPDVVKRLQELAEQARNDLGDRLIGREGKGVRPPGRV